MEFIIGFIFLCFTWLTIITYKTRSQKHMIKELIKRERLYLQIINELQNVKEKTEKAAASKNTGNEPPATA